MDPESTTDDSGPFEWAKADEQIQRIENRVTELTAALAKMVIAITLQNNAEFVRHIYDAEQLMQTVESTNQSKTDETE